MGLEKYGEHLDAAQLAAAHQRHNTGPCQHQCHGGCSNCGAAGLGTMAAPGCSAASLSGRLAEAACGMLSSVLISNAAAAVSGDRQLQAAVPQSTALATPSLRDSTHYPLITSPKHHCDFVKRMQTHSIH